MKIVDALKNLAVAIEGSGSAEDITEERIADIIQYIADNWAAGGIYTLPAASAGALGGVKLASAVTDVAAADASTAVSGTYTQAEVQAIATLANANKAAVNGLLAALRASGALASSE